MSLMQSGINLQQVKALKDILEIVSSPEKKAKLLGEVEEIMSASQAAELKSQEAALELTKVAKAASAEAELAKARSAQAAADVALAAKEKAEAAEAVAKAKTAGSKLAQERAAFEAETKDRYEFLKNREVSLAAAEKSLVEEREKLAAQVAEYEAKAEKLKALLGG